MPGGLALLDWPPTPNFLAFSFCQAPPSTAYTCASTCIQMIFSCLFEKGRKYTGIYGDFLFQELCVLTLPINTDDLGHRKIKTIRWIIYGSIRLYSAKGEKKGIEPYWEIITCAEEK